MAWCHLSTEEGVPSFYKLYRKALNNSLLYFYVWRAGDQAKNTSRSIYKETLVGN
jgi:hypothetical protein